MLELVNEFGDSCVFFVSVYNNEGQLFHLVS